MTSRALYLYQPLGGKPSSSWRDVLFNPMRCTSILLIVVLSLTSIGFILIQHPWGETTLAPNIFMPHEEELLIPELDPPIPEFIDDTVYDPFIAPYPEDALVDQTVRPNRAQSALSSECVDKWVSTGVWHDPCRYSMVEDSHIDLVYVWVNGSDPLHQKARNTLLRATGYKTKEARFREHDELRYSLRAARNATATWRNSTWHVITADVPEPATNSSAPDHSRRLGLVPQWLDIECSFYGCEGEAPIRLHHDTQLFRLTGRPGSVLTDQDAATWLGKILPSFNSHAVESQLPQLDPDLVSENIVALNDDQFMILPLPPSAFHTTLYGPVFRMDPGLMVGGDSSGTADGGGEWRSLGWSAHLLNGRFGTRKRPYMQHNARALSLPLMHEVSLAFGEYFAATPLSQFRGSHKVPMEYEVNTIFIATHYVVERHREALLWSWVVGKWGGASGMIDRGQKKRMWAELGGGLKEDTLTWATKAERTTSYDVEVNLLMAGVQPPHSVDSQKQGDTSYSWVSMDGYTPNFRTLASRIDIKRGDCIGDDAEIAWDMFRRLLKGNIACGDNVIAALLHKSKNGLEPFLPAPSPQAPEPSASEPIILPFDLPSEAPPLPVNLRDFAVRLLMRYAYVLGDSPTTFMTMKDTKQMTRLLTAADKQKDIALLCMNDDLGNGNLKAANDLLKEWFEGRWPDKLGCEL